MSGKSCGDCGLCCKLLAIEALDKKDGDWCGHFRKGGSGCGIYADRPNACRVFSCMWLHSERLDDTWKPNKARMVLYTDPDGRRLNVVVDPADPTAWRREPYYGRIKAMSSRAEEGYQLVVSIGRRRIVVFQYDEFDLGLIEPEHRIVSGFAMVEGERRPYAMVLSDAEATEAARQA